MSTLLAFFQTLMKFFTLVFVVVAVRGSVELEQLNSKKSGKNISLIIPVEESVSGALLPRAPRVAQDRAVVEIKSEPKPPQSRFQALMSRKYIKRIVIAAVVAAGLLVLSGVAYGIARASTDLAEPGNDMTGFPAQRTEEALGGWPSDFTVFQSELFSFKYPIYAQLQKESGQDLPVISFLTGEDALVSVSLASSPLRGALAKSLLLVAEGRRETEVQRELARHLVHDPSGKFYAGLRRYFLAHSQETVATISLVRVKHTPAETSLERLIYRPSLIDSGVPFKYVKFGTDLNTVGTAFLETHPEYLIIQHAIKQGLSTHEVPNETEIITTDFPVSSRSSDSYSIVSLKSGVRGWTYQEKLQVLRALAATASAERPFVIQRDANNGCYLEKHPMVLEILVWIAASEQSPSTIYLEGGLQPEFKAYLDECVGEAAGPQVQKVLVALNDATYRLGDSGYLRRVLRQNACRG